jgi:hypothetical protein
VEQIPNNDHCPCYSGKKFKSCCKKKSIFFLNEKGDIIQRLPVSKKAFEILDKYEKEFTDFFGRRPGKGDIIFFKSLISSKDDYYDNIDELFELVGLPPEKAYASRKTGYAVSEMNKHLIPEKVLKEWKSAVKEYRDIKSGKKKINIHPFIKDVSFIQKKIEDLQHLYALLLHKINERIKEDPKALESFDYLLFCFTKNLKTLRAILLLIERHFGEDALNLIRSVFENYLHISNVINNTPGFIEEMNIKNGIYIGTHKISKPGSSKVTNIQTGKEYQLKFTSNFRLSALHPQFGDQDKIIYEFLYNFLSRYTHPDYRSLPSYLNLQERFTQSQRTQISEAVVYCGFLNMLLINELKKWGILNETDNFDISKLLLT